ncbi:MAG: extracellular solute-binding protein [Chloroflexi bacterium]|nr:extracellular solute-binding protein [Chloroflexota bacterium]
MKGLLSSLMAVISLLGLVLAACAGPSSPAPEVKTVRERTAVPGAKAGWEQDWANILGKAKEERTVTVYFTGWGQETRIVLTETVKKKFGIDVEFYFFGRGVEMVARTERETAAGLNVADIIGTGAGTLLPIMKPQGLLGDIEPLLVLPEVTDPRAWLGGKFPFIDKDRTAVGMVANTARYVTYNTDMVKKDEITTYKDLLKPQYRGKLMLGDPAISGSGQTLFASLARGVWNMEETLDFLRQLIKQQEVVIQRDPRLLVELVARGKYAVVVGAPPVQVKEFLKAGAPIDLAFVKEGTTVSATNGTFGVRTALAHPNAARVLVNWLLTKEGQTVFSRLQGIPSSRIDVPTEGLGLDPRFLPQPGEKLVFEDEEMILFRGGELTSALNEVIRQAGK